MSLRFITVAAWIQRSPNFYFVPPVESSGFMKEIAQVGQPGYQLPGVWDWEFAQVIMLLAICTFIAGLLVSIARDAGVPL